MIRLFNSIFKFFLLALAHPTRVFCSCIEQSGSKKETMYVMAIFGLLAWLGIFFLGFVFIDVIGVVK